MSAVLEICLRFFAFHIIYGSSIKLKQENRISTTFITINDHIASDEIRQQL